MLICLQVHVSKSAKQFVLRGGISLSYFAPCSGPHCHLVLCLGSGRNLCSKFTKPINKGVGASTVALTFEITSFACRYPVIPF